MAETTATKSKLTELIEQSENNLRVTIDQYNTTIDQLEHLKRQSLELRDKVLMAQERYNTLIELNAIKHEIIHDTDGLISTEVVRDNDGNVLLRAKNPAITYHGNSA